MADPVQFMSHHTAVEYKIPEPSLLSIHFGEELAKARIIGHQCPQCSKVYMPPRGYCPLCVVETTEADEVEVVDRRHGHDVLGHHAVAVPGPGRDRGLRAGHDPARRRRHHDHGDAHGRHPDRRHAHGHARARGVAAGSRSGPTSATASVNRGMGLGDAVERWEPTGEPDLTREQIAEHISRDARRRDRFLRAGAARAAAGPDRDADVVADDHRGARRRRHDAARRGVHVLGQRRLPHRRHVHVRADARSRGRVAADLRVARGDGRRVGALRSVGALAARRRRCRARVRVGPREPRRVAARDAARSSSIPYYLAPIGADYVSLAALQAQAVLAKTGKTEKDLAEIVAERRRDASGSPNSAVSGDASADELLEERLRGRAVARARHRPAGRRRGRDRARRR